RGVAGGAGAADRGAVAEIRRAVPLHGVRGGGPLRGRQRGRPTSAPNSARRAGGRVGGPGGGSAGKYGGMWGGLGELLCPGRGFRNGVPRRFPGPGGTECRRRAAVGRWAAQRRRSSCAE